MKKLLILLCALSTFVANAQTFYSGTYNAVFQGNSDIIIAAGQQVTFTTDNIGLNDAAHIEVKRGAFLTFSAGLATNNSIIIDENATLQVNGSLVLNSHPLTDSGLVYITADLNLNGGSVVMGNSCAFIQTKNLDYSVNNVFSGTGLLYVTNAYNNQYSDQYYTGHPLTSSTGLYVNTGSTHVNIGSAKQSIATSSPCATVTPVTFVGAPQITAVYKNYVTVQFTVANQSQMKQYIVNFSRDKGKTWEQVAVVIPDNTETGKTYSVNISLNQ